MASHWPCRSCALGLSRACRSRRCTRSCRVLGCWGVRWCLHGRLPSCRAGGWVQDAGTLLPGLAWRPFDLRWVGEGKSCQTLGRWCLPRFRQDFFPRSRREKSCRAGRGEGDLPPVVWGSVGEVSGESGIRAAERAGERRGQRRRDQGVSMAGSRQGSSSPARPLDLQGPEPGCLRGGGLLQRCRPLRACRKRGRLGEYQKAGGSQTAGFRLRHLVPDGISAGDPGSTFPYHTCR